MRHYSIRPNKNIFTTFVGLIASGYNLAENNCNRDIINSIRQTKYDEDIIDYFKKARNSTCEVNPYWPRTFLLSLASLFITEEFPYEYTDFQKMLDYIENKIYIIASKLDKESIVHELLHYILDIRLEECRNLINENLFLLKPILDEMVRYQYAWDYSKDSWKRVFEENFMRAASTWIIFHDDINNAWANANLHKDYGFIYVPIILEQISLNWKGLDNFYGFIEDCLKACRNLLKEGSNANI